MKGLLARSFWVWGSTWLVMFAHSISEETGVHYSTLHTDNLLIVKASLMLHYNNSNQAAAFLSPDGASCRGSGSMRRILLSQNISSSVFMAMKSSSYIRVWFKTLPCFFWTDYLVNAKWLPTAQSSPGWCTVAIPHQETGLCTRRDDGGQSPFAGSLPASLHKEEQKEHRQTPTRWFPGGHTYK